MLIFLQILFFFSRLTTSLKIRNCSVSEYDRDMNGISPLTPRSLSTSTSPNPAGPTSNPKADSGEEKGFDPTVRVKLEGCGDSLAGSDLLTSEGKIGVKRPSQEDSQEAPKLKKSNLDLKSMFTSGISGMTVSQDENVFKSYIAVSP